MPENVATLWTFLDFNANFTMLKRGFMAQAAGHAARESSASGPPRRGCPPKRGLGTRRARRRRLLRPAAAPAPGRGEVRVDERRRRAPGGGAPRPAALACGVGFGPMGPVEGVRLCSFDLQVRTDVSNLAFFNFCQTFRKPFFEKII